MTNQTGVPDASTDLILYEKRQHVALVTLNRPATGNAQSYPLLYALDDALMRAVADDDVRVVILTGAGKHFSSGHDVGTRDLEKWERRTHNRTSWNDHTNLAGAERQYVAEQELYLGLCRRWREIPKPTIAAVQGACMAGGIMLAWICDLIIASEDAFFSDNTVSMGIPGVEYFAHAFELPPRVAREFLLLGERMTAARAERMGMVNRVVPREQLLDTAFATAQHIADQPRFAVTLAKQACNFVEDIKGKRTAIDGAFGMHHLAHSHNVAVTGRSIIIPSHPNRDGRE